VEEFLEVTAFRGFDVFHGEFDRVPVDFGAVILRPVVFGFEVFPIVRGCCCVS